MPTRLIALVLLCLLASPIADAKELTVTLAGNADDPRAAGVQRAIDYWNEALKEAGSRRHLVLGPTVPSPWALSYYLDPARAGGQPEAPPPGFDAIAGDIVIAMPDANFISFTLRSADDRRFIGLRSTRHPLLDKPGVAENIAAHEIGHALGLPHTTDAADLMCGAPTPCRPDRFASGQGAIFPLSDAGRAQLAKLD